MTVINSNSAAMLTANSITKNDREMTQTMERLSTGKRINSAADDAAGLAIATKMTSQIRGLDQAGRNANNATSMLQLADGSAEQISNILQRMREIVVQAADGSNTTSDVNVLNVEFKEAASEVDRIVETTQFNGKSLLNGDAGGTGVSSVTFQIGANAGQTLAVEFSDFNLAAGAAATPMGADLSGYTSTGMGTNLATTLAQIDTAIAGVATQRATFGATMNRLEYAADNLSTSSLATATARGRIEDANYATETTSLARSQIIAQAGTAMLAQANQKSQSVLSLLQ
ncbi:MAG: flagellin [Porticoccaceae bacterium]|nr:flagellin [Porticoccaceae bacterium]